MSKMMVLGAGISQVPLIRTAKNMGLEVIVASAPGNYPGFAIADKVYEIDTTDAENLCRAAERERIDGVCTTGTDVAVRALAKVASVLGLPAVSVDAALKASNKWSMKRAFAEHGVRTAPFRRVHSASEARKALRELGYPAVIKAVDSGGSKGIVKVDGEAGVDAACRVVAQATRLDFFIVERYIDGEEFGAQAFVYDRKLQFVMPHGDIVFYGDTGVPVGHYVPCTLPESVLSDVREQLERAVRALGVDCCAVKADFMLSGGQVYVLEIGARAGATCLPELVSTHYGFNYYEQMIRAAMGWPTDFRARAARACACELICADRTGILVAAENRNPPHEDILDISFDYPPGSLVRKFHVGTDRIGQIIVQGADLPSALSLLARAKQNIHLDIRVAQSAVGG